MQEKNERIRRNGKCWIKIGCISKCGCERVYKKNLWNSRRVSARVCVCECAEAESECDTLFFSYFIIIIMIRLVSIGHQLGTTHIPPNSFRLR